MLVLIYEFQLKRRSNSMILRDIMSGISEEFNKSMKLIFALRVIGIFLDLETFKGTLPFHSQN